MGRRTDSGVDEHLPGLTGIEGTDQQGPVFTCTDKWHPFYGGKQAKTYAMDEWFSFQAFRGCSCMPLKYAEDER